MNEQRKDAYGTFRFIVEAEGYVMARRPGAAPMIFSRKEWDKMATPEDWDAVQTIWDRHAK